VNANPTPPPKLDPRERHFRIPSHHAGLELFLRHLPPPQPSESEMQVVLYVHGATFPSATSIAHRLAGRSWRDELCAAGFHVWGLDFHGYGLSDPHPGMRQPANAADPLGRAEDASRQVEAAVRFITAHHATRALSIIAHSWGTIVAARFAGRCPDLVRRMVFFGPIARRDGQSEPPRLPAWKLVSVQDQWDRFIADTPRDETPVMLERHFAAWSEAYLDGDAASRSRTPPAVQVPLGPLQDIQDAWAGRLPYDPGLIQAPVAIVRGNWDSLCTDADAAWLFDALAAAPIRRDVKIARAGHLMHLEEGRYALYRETEIFLQGRDEPGGS
jgi:pimeloyl-ACP methyl ester carboxylesterase